ncbi:TRAM domain-containing protein [Rubinisphaera sp.]|uniref:PIN/TRAM domain-containing protein n=1 Tax=Rubinisphaera sp. TaxID=2024857 RepID=UPI000C11623F|nr:TRAM domain-containing protein [Rubinisphaera sp.]MBV11742.1 PIN/TRAM domain-containing protein [Rubinisphaera sp.]HCS54605.1 PIN/TRAM domain-containing protein [Planctomycetaceae bacterium]|tara:strand:+ start:5657 stop:6742 length:1086 start_codon:yes stop_codon:yes gene_type:complete
MLLGIIRAVFICIAAGAFATFVSQTDGLPDVIQNHRFPTFFGLMAIAVGVIVVDVLIRRKRIEDLSALYFGLLIGVLLSYLLIQAVEPMFEQAFEAQGRGYYNMFTMVVILTLPYFCISFLMQTKDDFRFIIPYVEFSRELKGGRPLVVDSHALIDGRIAELVETHVIDSQLLVPDFVLEDLQRIADSGDKVRRGRGRRGLDVLSRIQQHPHAEIRIHNTSTTRGKTKSSSHDQLLIDVALAVSGRIVTNDVNINKIASVQNVDVVNLNDVSNALKPKYIPGEHVRIQLIKEGESYGQGVGYLDDGTMVVCEQGKDYVGKEVDVEVTSVLQNSAGRMIFGKPSGSEGPTPSRIPRSSKSSD